MKPVRSIIIAAILKKGPKGIIFVFFSYKIISDIGRPIIEPRNIVRRDISHPRMKPKKNISLRIMESSFGVRGMNRWTSFGEDRGLSRERF